MSEPTVVIVVNPDDVNLPSVKALAASYGASVVGSPYVPHMQALFIDPAALRAPWEDDA